MEVSDCSDQFWGGRRVNVDMECGDVNASI